MNDRNKQEQYWDRTVKAFDSIYTHQKSAFANKLDARFRWEMYERFTYTMREANPIEGKTILDVGCGTGLYSIEFAKRKARKVIGIDISSNMLETCSARAREHVVESRTEFIHTDLLHYDPNEKFDLVIGIGLFDYIRRPVEVLARMKEVCKEKVILSFPRNGTWRVPIRKVRLNLQGCDVFFYSFEDIKRYLQDAGYSRFEHVVYGQLYCITAYV